MILINTTFCVDKGISEEFISFLRDTYIPLAKDSGMYAMLLSEMREQEQDPHQSPTRTLALQMRAPSSAVADAFCEDVLTQLYNYIVETWGQRVVLFETILDVLVDSAKQ